jgi:hypothetical protein
MTEASRRRAAPPVGPPSRSRGCWNELTERAAARRLRWQVERRNCRKNRLFPIAADQIGRHRGALCLKAKARLALATGADPFVAMTASFCTAAVK